ncbi:MAG: hypothetical protein JOY71_15480 [Acetobacteraceae bacterium]|nr:hypothetical protein [Acetobacteraceae bacterium]
MPEQTTRRVEPDNRVRLQGLARFVPIFTAPGFTFATWEAPPSDSSGIRYFGYCALSDEAQRFVQTAYDLNWVQQFNWSEWMNTPAGKKLWENPKRIAKASTDDLARILTVWIRGERLNEGALNTAFESGVLTAIVKRAAALLHDLPASTGDHLEKADTDGMIDEATDLLATSEGEAAVEEMARIAARKRAAERGRE